MVNKELILKAFDTTIKSHQHLRLNGNVLPAFSSFHDKHCGKKPRKSEIAIFVDKNGDEVFTKKGNKTSVGFTDKEIKDAYEKYGELNVTHNHPRDNLRPCAEALSRPDVMLLKDKVQLYGKRDDGSEGVLGEFYPFKSISCESSNGSRMTLVRGDKFSSSDEDLLFKASRRLEDYHVDYYRKFYETMSDIRSNTNLNDFASYEDYENAINKATFGKMGMFDENKEFKDIQRMFRDANCKLTMTYPSDFQVGLWQ